MVTKIKYKPDQGESHAQSAANNEQQQVCEKRRMIFNCTGRVVESLHDGMRSSP